MLKGTVGFAIASLMLVGCSRTGQIDTSVCQSKLEKGMSPNAVIEICGKPMDDERLGANRFFLYKNAETNTVLSISFVEEKLVRYEED